MTLQIVRLNSEKKYTIFNKKVFFYPKCLCFLLIYLKVRLLLQAFAERIGINKLD